MEKFEVRNDEYGSRGFWMTFKNGYTVSVQFGRGNYCDESRTAEIAAWDTNNKWYRPDHWDDNVKGWCTPDEVAQFIAEVAAL